MVETMQPKFRYVYIPADCNEAIEEKEMLIPEGKDVECFLDKVKRHFSAAGGERTEHQKQTQRKLLMEQLGDKASNVDPTLLNTAINMQMVENISLLPNSQETKFIGVNMYCDDQAQLKGLEPNPRASQMAQCCGKLIEVRGDAFVARIFDNEDEFRRMDLTLQELTSSADWVKTAASIAQRKQNEASLSSQQDFLDRMKQKHVPQPSGAVASPATRIHELSPAEVEKDEGNAAFKKGDWQAAVDRYTAALTLDPTLLSALNNRALALLKLRRFEEAELDCSQVLQVEPGNVKALLRRATAAEHLADKKLQALQDIEAALKQEPGNQDALAAQQRLLPPPPPPPQLDPQT